MRVRVANALETAALMALLGLVAWGPLAQGSVFPAGRLGVVVLGASAFALWLAAAALARRPALSNPLWAAAAMSLAIWTGISVAFAVYPFGAAQEGALFASVVLAGIAAQGLLRTVRRRATAGLWLLAVATVAAGYAVAQKLGYEFTVRNSPEHLSSFYYNPSHYAGFVTLALPVALWAALFHRHALVRVVGAATAAAFVYSLAFTDSSTLPAALLAATGVVALRLWYAWRPLGIVAAVAIVAGLTVAGWMIARPEGQAQLGEVTARLGLRNSVQGFIEDRMPIWSMDARAARAAPLTGFGPSGFAHVAPRFRPERTPGSWTAAFGFVNYAHNDYYQLAIELGWPGLALYALVLAATIATAFRQDGLGGAALIGLLCVWLAGLWDGHGTAIPGTMAWLWVLAGLVAAGPARHPANLIPSRAAD